MPGPVPPASGLPPPRFATARRLLLAQSRAWVKWQRLHAGLGGGTEKPRRHCTIWQQAGDAPEGAAEGIMLLLT
jgi:hypothetical protein